MLQGMCCHPCCHTHSHPMDPRVRVQSCNTTRGTAGSALSHPLTPQTTSARAAGVSSHSEPLDVLGRLEVYWVCLLSCVDVLPPHLDRLVSLTRHQPAGRTTHTRKHPSRIGQPSEYNINKKLLRPEQTNPLLLLYVAASACRAHSTHNSVGYVHTGIDRNPRHHRLVGADREDAPEAQVKA